MAWAANFQTDRDDFGLEIGGLGRSSRSSKNRTVKEGIVHPERSTRPKTPKTPQHASRKPNCVEHLLTEDSAQLPRGPSQRRGLPFRASGGGRLRVFDRA